MRRHLSCLALCVLMTSPVLAVDLATSALVEIVNGITLQEITGMDFGRLVLNDGTVTISPSDGSLGDPGHLVINSTNVSQGIFNVNTVNGAGLTASAVAGAMPAGVLLSAFVFDWDDGTVDPDYTVVNASNARLEVGANLTISAANASVTGGPTNLPYTLSVTFQ